MEYVLDAAPPPPTLAQRLGLVEAPPPLLTAEEWVGVKASSNARKDSALPCPICQDQFGVREQVSTGTRLSADWHQTEYCAVATAVGEGSFDIMVVSSSDV